MANGDKLRKYKSLYSSTTNTFGTGTGETITPASVVGLPTDTNITLTFDRVDGSGTATPSKMERIKGYVSGGNFIIEERGVDGTTEQAHTTPVVEMIWNAEDWNDALDAFLVGHGQDGTHASTIAYLSDIPTVPVKATGAEINSGTDDAKFATPKAIADSKLADCIRGDGWVAVAETWTYASANTFTVSGDKTTRYSKGTRVKWTQTTVKYGTVVSSSYNGGTGLTTVTLISTSDYSIANAPISDNYCSYAANPQGYPEVFNYVPTLTAGNSDLSGYTSATFSVVGSMVFFDFLANNKNVTGTSGSIQVSLPCAGSSSTIIIVSAVHTGTWTFAHSAIYPSQALVEIYKTVSAGAWAGNEEGIYINIKSSYAL